MLVRMPMYTRQRSGIAGARRPVVASKVPETPGVLATWVVRHTGTPPADVGQGGPKK
jgi:hypothetical protein